MIKKSDKAFYRVDGEILPEAIKKTIAVKELLASGACATINEAVRRVDLSRSAYYKYKDHVVTSAEAAERTHVLFVTMQNDQSLLGRILRKINSGKHEILTINLEAPVPKRAFLVIVFKTRVELPEVQVMVDALRRMKGVRAVNFTEEGSKV